ncbi:MAG: hypothetical protein R3A47_04895 [Polyangiales bacterium]
MGRGQASAGNFGIALATLVCCTAGFGCVDDTPLLEQCATSKIELCIGSAGFADPYPNELALLSWPATIRKASLELTGKLPTDAQLRAASEHEQLGAEAAISEMMRDPAFFDRVKEIFNDKF